MLECSFMRSNSAVLKFAGLIQNVLGDCELTHVVQ